jgi:hypothetical protein
MENRYLLAAQGFETLCDMGGDRISFIIEDGCCSFSVAGEPAETDYHLPSKEYTQFSASYWDEREDSAVYEQVKFTAKNFDEYFKRVMGIKATFVN